MNSKWSWVKGGIALGILNILMFLSGNHLGTTTAYAQTTGYLVQFFKPQLIPVSNWTAGTCGGVGTLEVGWQWMLVLGVFLGGFLGKLIHNRRKNSELNNETDKELQVPALWAERYGVRPKLRMMHALLGGVLLLFGSRMAGGCTSSHIISGMSQMAVSGILFAVAVFASGIPTAILIYKRRRIR